MPKSIKIPQKSVGYWWFIVALRTFTTIIPPKSHLLNHWPRSYVTFQANFGEVLLGTDHGLSKINGFLDVWGQQIYGGVSAESCDPPQKKGSARKISTRSNVFFPKGHGERKQYLYAGEWIQVCEPFPPSEPSGKFDAHEDMDEGCRTPQKMQVGNTCTPLKILESSTHAKPSDCQVAVCLKYLGSSKNQAETLHSNC